MTLTAKASGWRFRWFASTGFGGFSLRKRCGLKWDEVHEIAEQLEHIKSDELINRFDHFWAIRGLIRMAIPFRPGACASAEGTGHLIPFGAGVSMFLWE